MTAHPPRPLDGITVVSLEHAIAAPFCTRQLADQGARVIKIERPGAGDDTRRFPGALERGRDQGVEGTALGQEFAGGTDWPRPTSFSRYPGRRP